MLEAAALHAGRNVSGKVLLCGVILYMQNLKSIPLAFRHVSPFCYKSHLHFICLPTIRLAIVC